MSNVPLCAKINSLRGFSLRMCEKELLLIPLHEFSRWFFRSEMSSPHGKHVVLKKFLAFGVKEVLILVTVFGESSIFGVFAGADSSLGEEIRFLLFATGVEQTRELQIVFV